jgi:hypothetical protein
MPPQTHGPQQEEAASQDPTTECRLQYTVPEWFLDNIKTPHELSNAKPRIWLTNETSFESESSSVSIGASCQKPPQDPKDDEHSSCFRVSQDDMDNLLDNALSLQMSDRLGRLTPSRSSFILSCCMRFGLQFLDELVSLLAQELNSTLISLNANDLEDIGLEFYYQELGNRKNTSVDEGNDAEDDQENNTSSTGDSDDSDDAHDTSQIAKKALRCYFGGCGEAHAKTKDRKRGKDALLAILNAVNNKGPQTEAYVVSHGTSHIPLDNTGTTQSPVILYFRDVLTLATRKYYRAPDAVIREAVRESRKAGENIIMIFAATHTDADEAVLEPDLQIPWKILGCQRPLCNPNGWQYSIDLGLLEWIDSRLPMTSVLPLGVPADWSQERKVEWQGSVISTRIQSFKRRLYAQLSQYPSSPPGILEPHCDWFTLLPESVIQLFASTSFNTEIQYSFNLILARCSRKRAVDLNDIRAILLRLNKRNAPTPSKHHDSEQEHRTSEDETWVHFPPQTQTVIRSINSKTPEENGHFYWEKRFLSLIVNPKRVEADWSDLAIDTQMEQEIKQLIHNHHAGLGLVRTGSLPCILAACRGKSDIRASSPQDQPHPGYMNQGVDLDLFLVAKLR